MIRRRTLLNDHKLTEREQKSLALLELIRQRGPLTRTGLSQGTGFNIVTVSNYVAEFIKQGLVSERGFDVSSGGRKPVLVELNAKAGFVIGIDLAPMGVAGVEMTGVMTDLHGSVVHRIVATRAIEAEMDMDRTLTQAAQLVHRLIETSPIEAEHLHGIGIGLPGIMDERAGTVRQAIRGATRSSYTGLQDRLEREVKLPVLLGNDASLAGYGEYRLGLDRPVENMVYCYSDVGASLIMHGHVYWGASGSAGELGVHVPSDDDYLTWIKSPAFVLPNDRELGIASQARKLVEEGHPTAIRDLAHGQPSAITFALVLQAALNGDPVARELIEHAAMQLGIRIAMIVNLFNPEVVIIGGGIEKAGALLLEPVWRAVKRYAYEEPASLVDVLPAKLGDNAVALGAACWVIREVFIQA